MTNTQASSELISIAEAGRRYLGMTRQGVAYQIARGNVPCVLIGRKRFVPAAFFKDAIDQALADVDSP